MRGGLAVARLLVALVAAGLAGTLEHYMPGAGAGLVAGLLVAQTSALRSELGLVEVLARGASQGAGFALEALGRRQAEGDAGGGDEEGSRGPRGPFHVERPPPTGSADEAVMPTLRRPGHRLETHEAVPSGWGGATCARCGYAVSDARVHGPAGPDPEPPKGAA